MECRLRDGQVALQLRSTRDIDLEQWAAERVGDVFRQVYDRPLAIGRREDEMTRSRPGGVG